MKNYMYYDTAEGLREQLITMCELFVEAQGSGFETSHHERYRHKGKEGYNVPMRLMVDVWGEKLSCYTEISEELVEDEKVMTDVKKGLLRSMAYHIQRKVDFRKILLRKFEKVT